MLDAKDDEIAKLKLHIVVLEQMLGYAIDASQEAQRQAGQEPIALIDNGTFRWHIPTPTYSVPLNLLRGQHWVYAAPQPAAQPAVKPLTPEQIESTIRNWFADDWAIDKARGLLGDLGITATQGAT